MRKTTGELTEREKELVRCLMDGMAPKEIGAKLCLSVGTVNQYASGIRIKLGARTTVQAVVFCIARGFCPLS